MGIGDARGDELERFGTAVAIDGDTAVVGAPGHDLPVSDSGAAYVFLRTGNAWALAAKLSPSDPGTNREFGSAVAISGDTIAVGTASSSSSASVYVFIRSGAVWTEQARLTASDTQAGDAFGAAVAISVDTLVVGAPQDTTGFGFRSGSVYVFTRSGTVWTEQQKLLPSDLAADDRFGHAVGILGDSLAAGSPADDTGLGIDAGSAYVFTRSGGVWTQEQKLTAPSGADGDRFGSSVSIGVDVVAVGAPWEQSVSVAGGAAHVFRRAGGFWSQEQRIVTQAPAYGEEFGAAVSLGVDLLVVGAPGETVGALQTGAAHAFAHAGGVWTEEQSLNTPTAGPFAELGRAVAVSVDTALVGAPSRDDYSGSAFAFRRTGATWAEEARLDGPGTASHDSFGGALDLEGDVLVVGAPDDDIPAGRDAGSVYVFARTGTGWALEQKIVASDASGGAGFGTAVALSGDTLAVGAPGDAALGFRAGAAYVFVRSGGAWQEQQRLVAPDGDLLDEFGMSVSVDQDTFIVGAPNQDAPGVFSYGAAYVFVRTGASWLLEQKLVSSTAADFDTAGSAVAIEGNTAVVGAPGKQPGGVALAFERAGGVWSEQPALTGADTGSADRFGQALALSGGTLVVGAPRASVDGFFSAGAAYVFVRSAGPWAQQQKLVALQPSYSEELGAAVAVSGDGALIGAPGASGADYLTGAVLFFERARGSWTERQRIGVSDGAALDRLGSAVALSDGTGAAGAPSATTSTGVNAGAAYVFVPASADLSLVMTGSPPSVVQGDLVTYTIVMTNNGPDAAPAVGIDVSLGSGLFVETATPSQGQCTQAASAVACALGIVPVGASATVTVEAAAGGVGLLVGKASVVWAGSDPVPGNETASVSTMVSPGGPADVSVSKAGPPVASVGSSLSYTVIVSNLGRSTAAGIVVSDPTPPGLTVISIFGECTGGFPCTIPRIATGGSRGFSVYLFVPETYSGPDPIVNTVTVTTATADPNPSNDSATAQVPFFIPAHDLDFHTLPPCRLLDTRDPARGGPDPLPAGSVQVLLPAFWSCGVPAWARAIALNVTVTQPSAAGNLRLYPAGLPVPTISTVNYGPGQTRGNNTVVSLSSGGALAIQVGQATGSVHVILDVFGYFE